MTLFVDASALVAVLADEPDSIRLAEQIRDDDDPLWSAMSCWETVTALVRSYAVPAPYARRMVLETAAARPLRLVPIAEREVELALDAHQTYGKGNHRAALNMGDCFAYACAKANNARLLYKGDDFSRTDMA